MTEPIMGRGLKCDGVLTTGHSCPTVSVPAEFDLLPAGRLKKAVSEVLQNALNGQSPALRTDDGKYIRWGLVERIIHHEIDAEFNRGR